MKYDIQVIYGMCFFSYPSCSTWQQLKKSCGGGDAGSCFNNNGDAAFVVIILVEKKV